jgi:hypothetical protein
MEATVKTNLKVLILLVAFPLLQNCSPAQFETPARLVAENPNGPTQDVVDPDLPPGDDTPPGDDNDPTPTPPGNPPGNPDHPTPPENPPTPPTPPENPGNPDHPTPPENPPTPPTPPENPPTPPTPPENPGNPDHPTPPENPGNPDHPTPPENPGHPEHPRPPAELVECMLGHSNAKITFTSSFQKGSNARKSRVCMTQEACLEIVNAYAAERACTLSTGSPTTPGEQVQCTAIFPGSQGTCKNAQPMTDSEITTILLQMAAP